MLVYYLLQFHLFLSQSRHLSSTWSIFHLIHIITNWLFSALSDFILLRTYPTQLHYNQAPISFEETYKIHRQRFDSGPRPTKYHYYF